MNIAFLAHNKKKELMVQFCTAYKSVLMKHNLFATATTGRLIADNTGLPITLLLSHKQGGHQQINARIAYNEIDLVLLFVYSMAMLYGPQTGALTGAAAGLMYDFLSGAVFGFHTITRCMVGFVAGFIKGQVFKEHFAYHIVAALVITAGIRMLFFFVALFLTPVADLTFAGRYLQQSLAYCLGNILFVVPVYKLCYFISHWHKDE